MAASRQGDGRAKNGASPPKEEDESELWRRAMRDTRQLSQRRREAAETTDGQEADSGAGATSNRKTASQPGRAARAARQEPVQRTPPPPGKLDKHVVRRIKRGAQRIEARLDLHGMTQKEAHANLRRFIADTAARGCRCVLVITGKGGGSAAEAGPGAPSPGVLRREVPRWLAGPELAPLVAGFEAALPQHGGAGALYVQLRRRLADTR